MIADAIRDVPREYPMALLTTSQVAAELDGLVRALPESPDMPLDAFGNEAWADMMESLVMALGPISEADSVAAWGRSATALELSALHRQIQRAQRAVAQAHEELTRPGQAGTGILLPVSYAHRIQLLLGTGVLPVAWVRRLDVLRC